MLNSDERAELESIIKLIWKIAEECGLKGDVGVVFFYGKSKKYVFHPLKLFPYNKWEDFQKRIRHEWVPELKEFWTAILGNAKIVRVEFSEKMITDEDVAAREPFPDAAKTFAIRRLIKAI